MGQRQPKTVGRLRLTVVLAVTLLAASSAHAQTTNYDALIEEGLSEFQLGNWTEAYTLFKRAHEGSPNARTLRGMGMTSYELKRYPRALEQLKAALVSTDKPLTAELRAHVEGLIERSSRLVGSLDLTVNPPEAIVVVNREQTDKRRLVVPVGEVTVRAELPGREPIERIVIVDSGQSYAVHLDFDRSAEDPATSAVEPQVAVAPTPTPIAKPIPQPQETKNLDLGLATTGGQPRADDDSVVKSPWLWVGVGLAVAGGVLAAILLSGEDEPDTPVPPGNVGVVIDVLGAP